MKSYIILIKLFTITSCLLLNSCVVESRSPYYQQYPVYRDVQLGVYRLNHIEPYHYHHARRY